MEARAEIERLRAFPFEEVLAEEAKKALDEAEEAKKAVKVKEEAVKEEEAEDLVDFDDEELPAYEDQLDDEEVHAPDEADQFDHE